MKFKVTQKELRNERYIVSCGYCDLQNLLYFVEPVAYNAGAYGWNFDVYKADGLYITTGYRGMVGKTAVNIDKYEELAEKVRGNISISWDERKAEVERLLGEFVKEQKAMLVTH